MCIVAALATSQEPGAYQILHITFHQWVTALTKWSFWKNNPKIKLLKVLFIRGHAQINICKPPLMPNHRGGNLKEINELIMHTDNPS